ncbi:hypothetical protein CUMW_124260, partial [Citrus unshiu]
MIWALEPVQLIMLWASPTDDAHAYGKKRGSRAPTSFGSEILLLDCIFKIEKLENVLKQQVSFLPDGDWSSYAIFGPPLDEYWRKKLQEEAAAKDSDANSRRKQLTPTMLLWISKSLLSHIVSAIVRPLSQKPI